MGTEVKKAETFEPALEVARKLRVNLKEFLQARPEFQRSISNDRLNEILSSATTIADVPHLWDINNGYVCLKALWSEHSERYEKEIRQIREKVSKIIREALQGDQTSLNLRELRGLSKLIPNDDWQTTDSLKRQIKKQVADLLDPKRSIEELLLDRSKCDYDINYLALVSKKAKRRLGATADAEEKFQIIKMARFALTYADIVDAIEPVYDDSEDPTHLLQAIRLLKTKDWKDESEEDKQNLRSKIWLKLLDLKPFDRVIGWKAARIGKGKDAFDSARIWKRSDVVFTAIKKLLPEASLNDLFKIDEIMDKDWLARNFLAERNTQEVIRLWLQRFIEVLAASTEGDVRIAYETMSKRHERAKSEWRLQAKLEAIKTMYKSATTEEAA